MILIALGANLPSSFGVPELTFKAAVAALRVRGVAVQAMSRVYVSAPVPVSDQPDYRNAVMAVESDLSPAELLVLLKDIEAEFGRDNAAERNSARVLDLDIIAYNDVVMDVEGLNIPHPRMQQRGFVLYPLRDVVGEGWVHPVSGRYVAQMIAALPVDQLLDNQISEVA